MRGEILAIFQREMRALFARQSIWLWAAEIVGVISLAVGAWFIYHPAAAIVLGAYLIVVANTGGDQNAGS